MIPVDIKKNEEGNLTITWDDGHESIYPMSMLRKRCPCATCKTSRDNQNDSPLRVLSEKEVIPEDIKITEAEIVGRYAVQFTWSDGHHEGIYAFDYLKELCQCHECVG